MDPTPATGSHRGTAAESAAALGLSFADESLFVRALTHPSWTAEMGGDDYERLEFLGDSVLGLVVSEHLHEMFPDLPEGELTRMRTSVVRGGALADAARRLGVGHLIRLGKGAAKAGEQDRPSVLEAVFEALVAAVYQDAGLDAARAFVLQSLEPRLKPEALMAAITDAKTRLQELTQARGLGLPRYEVLSSDGPPHERTFRVAAVLEGRTLGSGSGASKQAASQAAAAEALLALE